MATRRKLTNAERARQFVPFDALKGLRDAIKLKEYEHDQIEKGILSEDQIYEISNILLNLDDNSVVAIEYYEDGYYLNEQGKAKLDTINNKITINGKEILLDNIHNIKFIN